MSFLHLAFDKANKQLLGKSLIVSPSSPSLFKGQKSLFYAKQEMLNMYTYNYV